MTQNRFEEALPAGTSVVVPVYNGAESIPLLVDRLVSVLNTSGDPFEIILVDDSSSDGSWAVIESLVATHPQVHGIAMARNFGQHPAIVAGLRSARYDVTVTMDDDLQHRPEEIAAMRGALAEDIDLVYGRAAEEEHGVWRNLSSRIVKGSLAAAVGNEWARQASAFRMFRTAMRGAFAGSLDPFISLDVLLSWGTTRVTAVTVAMDKRVYGQSNYTMRKLVRHAINMLTGFSVLPLRIVSLLGFGFSLLGVAILVFVLASYLIEGGSLPGFPFLASIIAIFSGAQLFALGVLGEYLGRIHFRSMQRPAYVVRQTTSGTDD